MDIDKLIKIATLEKNSSSKEAYRAIKTELLKNQTSKRPKKEGKVIYGLLINEEMFEINELEHQIISKLAKQREESISIYEANNRKDLADIEREQLKYLKELLPPEVSKEKIVEAIVEMYPNGFTKKEMGNAIKEITKIYPTADKKMVSEIAKEYIV